jgi:UDP-N-acetylmuramoyl-L-alanyl-D-glutamate--2,6-diaminopimelate ligase
MRFTELLQGVETLDATGEAEITAVEYDSRRIRPGALFLAMRGETTDGNRYIDDAIKRGASAVVSDAVGQIQAARSLAYAVVPHGRQALAAISANFYGHPAHRLKITGVTGTNGKTTTTFLIESLLRAGGRASALIGTIEYHIAGKVVPSPHTTPEALEINKFFHDALEAGVSEAVMEVSSHALAQGRVHGLPFDVAVFTNLTRDHLDYHGTMDNYFAAKALLFRGAGAQPPRVAIVNVDDEYGRRLAESSRKAGSELIRYGIHHPADCTVQNIAYHVRGTSFEMKFHDLILNCRSRLIGEVNVYNVMAAAMAAHARGCSVEQIEDGIADFARVPGRFERVDAGQPFTVVVDYAHTDDALRNLIRIARNMLTSQQSKGRIITLFGCGGDRDRTKRPLMGRAAGEGSDFVVLTSDNPRSEDPMAIIREAQLGLEQTSAKFAIEANRRKAIEIAVSNARAGDVVLIAGKGHEKYQMTREGTLPFDDVEVAFGVLNRLGYNAHPVPMDKGAPVA